MFTNSDLECHFIVLDHRGETEYRLRPGPRAAPSADNAAPVAPPRGGRRLRVKGMF